MDDKVYRPIMENDTHLGNSTKIKGAVSSLQFTNDKNEFVKPTDWIPVDKSELTPSLGSRIIEDVAVIAIRGLIEKLGKFAYNHINKKTEEMLNDRNNKQNQKRYSTSKSTSITIDKSINIDLSSQIDEMFNQIFVDKENVTEIQLAYFLGVIKGIWLSFKMQESQSKTIYDKQQVLLCNKVESLLNTIQKQDEVKIEMNALEKWFDMLKKDNNTISMEIQKSK